MHGRFLPMPGCMYINSDKNALATPFICFGGWQVGLAGTSRQDCRCYLKNEIKTMWGYVQKNDAGPHIYVWWSRISLYRMYTIPYTVYVCFYLFLLMRMSYLLVLPVRESSTKFSGRVLRQPLGSKVWSSPGCQSDLSVSRFANNVYIYITHIIFNHVGHIKTHVICLWYSML